MTEDRELENEVEMALCDLLQVDRGDPEKLRAMRTFLLHLGMWIDSRAHDVIDPDD